MDLTPITAGRIGRLYAKRAMNVRMLTRHRKIDGWLAKLKHSAGVQDQSRFSASVQVCFFAFDAPRLRQRRIELPRNPAYKCLK